MSTSMRFARLAVGREKQSPMERVRQPCDAFRGFVLAKSEVGRRVESAVPTRPAKLLALRERFAAERGRVARKVGSTSRHARATR